MYVFVWHSDGKLLLNYSKSLESMCCDENKELNAFISFPDKTFLLYSANFIENELKCHWK